MNYYIKTIWGPHGDWYPKGKFIEFPIKCKNASEKFKECSGFLIYETGREENGCRGRKTVFATGKISRNQENIPENKIDWGWYVRVDITKKTIPENGVPIKYLRELGIKQFQIPCGLIPITKNQFDRVAEKLNSK